ncbi:hypothetical protein [Cupriavidus basilensis]|uniref:hypothetical protein n=1 Tax=Cupriavidus basilensis TaxID=68895 RepID=UPI0011478831|nr:hypothetical protein [Cupriavidus basilensis]
MNQIKYTINPFIAFLIIGAILVVMSCYEIYGRASIEVDGEVINKLVVCQQPKNNRCVTKYIILSAAGENKSYSAGPTDQSLSRDFAIGEKIKKQKWKLSYMADERIINDFPIVFYYGLLSIGLLSIAIWFMKRKYIGVA